MELIAGIMLDVFFFARFTYIKTQFYKTKGVANGNDRRYISEFIYGYRGHNYVCSVKNNIFSRYHKEYAVRNSNINFLNRKAVRGQVEGREKTYAR